MKIEYKNGKMIITHPTGHVDIYEETYLKRIKALAEQDRDAAAYSVATIDNLITQVRSN